MSEILADRRSWRRSTLAWMIVGGVIGLVAAVALMVEKIELLVNPSYIPTCNINPVMACSSAMESVQSDFFGIPNPLVGVAGFPVVVTIGLAVVAGARLAPWFRGLLQVGVTFGVGYVAYLVYVSLYELARLCPYCMVVWTVMIPIFVYVTADNLQSWWGHHRIAATIAEYRLVILVLAYLAIIALITYEFWPFWRTLLF